MLDMLWGVWEGVATHIGDCIMFVVCYAPKGALHCEGRIYGPFTHYLDAEDFACTLPVALYCAWKYIDELYAPTEANVNVHAWEDGHIDRT